MIKFSLILFLICTLIEIKATSQNVFYQDIFKGGSTGAGFSTCQGSGNGTIEVFIEPGSNIKQAFLFAYKIGKSTSYNKIKFDGHNILFNNSTSITNDINNFLTLAAPFYSIHCIDVTNLVSETQLSYPVEIPPQFPLECPNCIYNALYLYIQYENINLDITATQIVINTHESTDISDIISSDLIPISINNDIGFAIHSDRIKDYNIHNDGTHIYIDNVNIGIIGGEDQVNSGFDCGVKGHYYYQNGTLFGKDDDVANNSVDGSDGIANISGILSQFQTNLQVKFELQTPNSIHSHSNYHLAYFLNHTTPCQEFPTTLNTTDTSLCR